MKPGRGFGGRGGGRGRVGEMVACTAELDITAGRGDWGWTHSKSGSSDGGVLVDSEAGKIFSTAEAESEVRSSSRFIGQSREPSERVSANTLCAAEANQ